MLDSVPTVTPPPPRPTSWRQLLLVAAFAAATVVGIDRWLSHRCQGVVLAQVDDGVAQLAAEDPVAIVLGSSQARSFAAVDEVLAAESGGATRVATVAIEDGRISTAAWVLHHRLRPLIEQRGADGRRLRSNLRHLIFVTDWWDSMLADAHDGRPDGDGVASRNLPGRAWTFGDFVDDVAAHGYDDYNKAFVAAAFADLFGDSVLVRDRGYGLLLRQLRHGRLEMSRAEHLAQIDGKRQSIEDSAPLVCAPAELRALQRIVDEARELGLQPTIVLYPALVETLSERARQTTMRRFHDAAAGLAARAGVPFFDWTYDSPLRLEHFRDHAHLNAHGHALLAGWALANDLAFLRDGKKQ